MTQNTNLSIQEKSPNLSNLKIRGLVFGEIHKGINLGWGCNRYLGEVKL